MRTIKLKNYVILAIIFLATITLVLFLKNVYEKNKEYNENTNERLKILYEIKEEDLKSYLIENRDIIIYTSYASDATLEEFENEFKKYIANEEISKEIIYLNLDKVSSDFHKNLKDKYFNDYMKTKKNLILNQNNLYAIEDGKVKNMLYEQNKKINLKDVEYFLKTNGVVEK